ncbi:autotransporter family protein [Plastoroseomonas arctica]|uniref:Autotransporter domain-containing protein n=1 Tax=Plastoroseomonas arctica TaxID=1509237 RepID=A0AAF1KUW6_9PROT|nr:autotransporter domain-containing protein [Plastoroseomonas arctica]MBR0657267.1 autotransporter domain-containing protein [Plastoroseomonas arctica]
MFRRFIPVLFGAVTVGLTAPVQAQTQLAVGGGITPLDTTGILGGVSMSASATTGTLSVGVLGGPQTDIFTQNAALISGATAVSTAASSQGNIVFNSSSTVFGAIGVTQPGGPFLRAISGGNTGTTVNFLGPVFATTLDVVGTGTVNFASGSTNITATNFAADGTIALAPNTTLIGALTSTAGANTGTLSLANGSVLNGAVGGASGLRSINVVGGSDTAGATATITGAANAFAFSLGTNTLNVGGALTIANGGAGGVVNTTLASPTVFGNIRPIGATNIGPTLLVNVTVPATSFIPVGTQFAVIQTRAGTLQSGTNGSVVSVSVQNPTNPLYTFAAIPAAGTIAGEVVITTTGTPLLVPVQPPVNVPLPPALPVAATIVPVLLAIAPAAPADLVINVLPAINALTTASDVVSAVAQLAPSGPAIAAPLVTYQGTTQFRGLLLSRLEDILCGPARPEEPGNTLCREEQRPGWWVRGFGYSGQQGTRDGIAGYDVRIVGTMIGYDAPLGPDTRAGIGFGFARSVVDGDTFGAGTARTSFNSYRATAYIGHEIGPWYVHGDVGIGLNAYTGERNIAFAGVSRRADADYSGQDYTGAVTTGYRFATNGFVVTPRAALQYTHVNIGAYTETGAGDLSLRVQSQSYDFVEGVLGLRIARPFTNEGMRIVPAVHANYIRELNNPRLSNTASFASAASPSFTTQAPTTGANTYNVGASINLLSCTCATRVWSVEASYDYEWRDERYAAHRGMLRMAGRF